MTRIIAGRYKGRRLEVPKGLDVRPTTDRMRERLFSMLGHHRYPDLVDARVLDLYAGTGALGLEALSRGAAEIVFVENARPSLACLNTNIQTLGASKDCKVIAANASALPATDHPFDIIFMDPPYRAGLVRPTLERVLQGGWLAPTGVICCELASDEEVEFPTALHLVDDRRQGQQRLAILMAR